MKLFLHLATWASCVGLVAALSNGTSTTMMHARNQHLRGVTTTAVPLFLYDDWKQDHRNTQAVHHHRDFMPLSCNLPTCNDGSVLWSSQAYRPAQGTVVIPCGRCVTMDHVDEHDTLILPFGLDIQGTLIFPDGYSITIETPFVRVQGVLKMTATQTVTDKASIHILLTGADENLTDFVPAGENEFKCSDVGASVAEACTVGNKPIVVAGGRLDIHGLPEACKTWVLLEDLATQESLPAPLEYTKLPAPTPNHPNPVCRSMGPYLSETFDTTNESHGWTGSYGAAFKVTTDGSFKVTDRESAAEHGPTFDLLGIRDCLISGQTYLLSVRVRLTKASEEPGIPTACSLNGKGCLVLRSTTRLQSGQAGSRMGFEVEGDGFVYGGWRDFYSTFTFSPQELDPAAIFHIIQFEGPDPEVDIEIDDFVLALPPKVLVPNPENVCGGNLIRNGNASANDIHPYPMISFGGRLTVATSENGDNFFRTEFRTSDTNSLAYFMDPPGCMVTGARYKVSARVRVRSNEEVVSFMLMRIFFKDNTSSRHVMAECPPSSRKWVNCESNFAMVEELDPEQVASIRLSFETVDRPEGDLDVDDWELAFLDGPRNGILVEEEGVAGCWDDGAEILITSHTMDFETEQIRRVVGAPKSVGNGLVRLHLDDFVIPAVTRRDDQDFAVEVALLSRNLVFEGATDESDSLMGGHLIVLHTPTVQQTLEGVELKNFGRQGELGRYPIHFHLSGNVDGALVSKNTIRASNQRCIVIHGSHNVTISDNVAFDTMGHCFMTEDGGEIDNKFYRNLGARTRAASRVVRSVETDNTNPSTFWCSNPVNEWVGNVAAGCEGNGFWFELQDSVRSPTSDMPLSRDMNPRLMPLKLFVDNVAHSNRKHGLRTYPKGFLPPKQAIFDNTRSYKNRQDGIFFHNSQDLTVRGGILADNQIGADFDRADNILIDGTTVIGVTPRFREIIDTQVGTLAHNEVVVGIELHGFATDSSLGGATIRDVTFSEFADTRSDHTALIQIDSEKWTGNFDFWTTIEGVQITDDVTPLQFNFLKAASSGVQNIYLTDIDSSMKPQGSTALGTSSVISDSSEMTAFLNLNQCESFPDRGFLYCSETCLRTVTFATSPVGTGAFVLRVTDRSNANIFFDYSGGYNYERNEDGKLDDLSNSEIGKLRYFSVSLPSGDYTASFLDRNFEAAWPTFVEKVFKSPHCQGGLEPEGVELEFSDASSSECRELIRNGDMEARTALYPHWLHGAGAGIEILPGKGFQGSNAIADIDQSSTSGYIGQFLDVRCLEEGITYEIRAMVRLERNEGVPFACNGSDCPVVRLRSRAPSDECGLTYSESITTVATALVRPLDDNGWNQLQGSLTIDSQITAATSVALTVERGQRNVKMFLDNVSMTRIKKDCAELIFNGDFADGTSAFWEKDAGSASLEMVSVQGNNALRMISRSFGTDTMAQKIQTQCLITGSRYLATAKMRLLNSDGTTFACDSTMQGGGNTCPRMRLRSFVDIGMLTQDNSVHDGGSIAVTDHGITSEDWHIMSGIFEATEYDQRAEKTVLSFFDAPQGKDLVIDDVSITRLPMTCNELIMNGNAEYGETASFWRQSRNVAGTSIDIVTLSGGNQAFKVSNRPVVGDGLSQALDSRCLKKQGDKWKVTARMKLVSSKTGESVGCDPLDTRLDIGCPSIRVSGYELGEKVEDERYYTTRSGWNAEELNDYETFFSVSDALAASDTIIVGIRQYSLDWDIIVDDISVTPVV